MSQKLLGSLAQLSRSWKPFNFSNLNFVRILASQQIEEVVIPAYVAHAYDPARMGESFIERYQVVGKSEYRASSPVWLARDEVRPHDLYRNTPLESLSSRTRTTAAVDT